jgi:hypothetical protein
MRDVVKQAIECIYAPADPQHYLELCGLPIPEIEALEAVHDEFEVRLRNLNPTIWPAAELHVRWPSSAGDATDFSSRLLISKFAPLFHVEHDFLVDFHRPDQMAPFLAGSSEQAFIKVQFQYAQKVSELLSVRGYTQLNYPEMEEVVCDLPLASETNGVDQQVTVRRALFFDLLGWCPTEEKPAPQEFTGVGD